MGLELRFTVEILENLVTFTESHVHNLSSLFTRLIKLGFLFTIELVVKFFESTVHLEIFLLHLTDIVQAFATFQCLLFQLFNDSVDIIVLIDLLAGIPHDNLR